jgi:hypothetical protein
MKKHRNKFIAVAFVLGVLAVTWVWGGNYAVRDGSASRTPPASEALAAASARETDANASVSEAREKAGEPREAGGAQTLGGGPGAEAEAAAETPVSGLPAGSADPDAGAGSADAGGSEASAETPPAAEPSPADQEAAPAGSGMVIDPETGKDKYLTDPVPEGKPIPVEPQEAVVGGQTFTCVLSVRCDTILDNMRMLDKEKHELVPADGVIFPPTTVTFHDGESVFNVLQREMKRAGIHMEFENTPIYNSAYIEGINNLYEFDVGELSGWMYEVNGWYPNYGCSRYQLKDGDLIEWNYTCDLGRDLGQYWLEGGYPAEQ